ncbi:MAG TPA: glycosyltransferase family 39 protein [Solirubrobacteraceae bacterium]|nr:glycosyltransferase family 39 protein [Solirubrobacteraceae bacterium]
MSRALVAGLIAVILIVALGLRIAEVQRTDSSYRPINDAGSYLSLGSDIAHTGDYPLSHRPGAGAAGTRGPSAYFAPGYPYFLALVDLIDGHAVPRDGAVHPARIAQAVLGTITVALIGLVAFELFGLTAGLIALVLAAVYPVAIGMAGTLVAENLLTPLVLAAVYAELRVRRAGRPRSAYGWVAGAGVLTGLATLTHENAILIGLPLLVAVWRVGPRRLLAPGLLIATTALTILPWTIRNAEVMHRFIPVSDETGITLVGTYNAASAANPVVPYKWRLFFGIPGERPLIRQANHLTEPELGDKLQHQALHYISDHPLAPLSVGYDNTLRLLELGGTFAWKATAASISLPLGVARDGVIGFWIVGLLALAGALSRAARAAPKWVWGVPLLLALSVVLVNVESPRFRAPIDPFLILLAAAGLASAATRIVERLGDRAPVRGQTGDAVATRPAELVEMRERLA